METAYTEKIKALNITIRRVEKKVSQE